mgnify:CR=1 FL=1|tara:strand:+ start:107 stop:712 length:606 start_codon:yes stop_codon:yes gene_type:complete
MNTKDYWEARYLKGKTSGAGSYGKLADYKAKVLTEFIALNNVQSVGEFGCGDGNQLGLIKTPLYTGLDISATAVQRCRDIYGNDPTKEFRVFDFPELQTFDLVISLDVVYHLLEDQTYLEYMISLFAAAERFVIIYSSNTDYTPNNWGAHQKNHKFTDWVEREEPDWSLIGNIPNPFNSDFVKEQDPKNYSIANFFIFSRQ